MLPGTGRTAYVAANGDLVLLDSDQALHLPVNALPDTRILVDESERILVLTDPTDRYDHGILGDRIEAASITLVETQAPLRVVSTIVVPEPGVIEGLSPIWVDLNADGRREIIVTIRDNRSGARLVVFDEKGNRIASGPAIGQNHRWRHQLSVAPFGPRGELEIADVLIPHIGGVVEFFQLEGSRLHLVASVRGYSTWTLPLSGRITTNLAAAVLSSGDLVLGVGSGDGTVRLWPPE